MCLLVGHSKKKNEKHTKIKMIDDEANDLIV